MGEGADEWERLQTSIGQGKTQITPMHNLMITAAIANGGTLMKPYMIDHVENAGGQTVKKFLPEAYGTLMSSEDASVLSGLMTAVVTDGTGSALRGAPYTRRERRDLLNLRREKRRMPGLWATRLWRIRKSQSACSWRRAGQAESRRDLWPEPLWTNILRKILCSSGDG